FFVLISTVHVMFPLRFPNSGIIARQRGGGAANHGQPPCSTGHPWPDQLQGVAGCGHGPLQGGGRLRPKPLARAAASMRGRPRAWLAPAGAAPAGVGSARGQAARGSHPRLGSKGRLPAARLQGAATRPGLPPARATAPEGAAPVQGGTTRP
ncbi:hypothetical protein BHM03_00056143, partial [Ensete ventricosum]